jgi:hypothetical protein
MSIPSTLIAGFIGLVSCGAMGSLILNSWWLIEVDPHGGGPFHYDQSLRKFDTGIVYEVLTALRSVTSLGSC